MNFGGIQKNSLIDYSGKISCVLFTSGCNFYCSYCHNPQLIPMNKEIVITEEVVLEFLTKRVGLVDGVVITGGEPTLQKGLCSFCRKVKKLGFPIKLDTNGSNPKVIEKLFSENLIDYIAMDIKSNLEGYEGLWQRNCKPNDILRSIHIIMTRAVNYEFRTTCVRPFVDLDIVEEIAQMIAGADFFVLQKVHRSDNLFVNKSLSDSSKCFADDELKEFAKIIGSKVKKCVIRW